MCDFNINSLMKRCQLRPITSVSVNLLVAQRNSMCSMIAFIVLFNHIKSGIFSVLVVFYYTTQYLKC